MTDDDHDHRQTIKLDSREIEELTSLPSFPDREEFVKTQEMDEIAPQDRFPTNPSLHVLETTQRYDVPEDLLELATRSQEMQVASKQEPPWREFVGIVDPHGRVMLPSRVQADVRGKKIRVKYIIVDE